MVDQELGEKIKGYIENTNSTKQDQEKSQIWLDDEEDLLKANLPKSKLKNDLIKEKAKPQIDHSFLLSVIKEESISQEVEIRVEERKIENKTQIWEEILDLNHQNISSELNSKKQDQASNIDLVIKNYTRN